MWLSSGLLKNYWSRDGRNKIIQNKIYRVLQNDEVVAIFNRRDYANDFIDYQATISDKEFEIEEVSLADL